MVNFRVDEKLNTLSIILQGNVEKSQVAEQLPIAMNCCNRLKDNFFIINDISKFVSNNDKDYIIMTQISEKLSQTFNIKCVLRVIGNMHIHKIKLQRVEKDKDISNVYYVSSKDDAYKLIGKLQQITQAS